MGMPHGILSYSGKNIGNFERTDSFSIELWFYQTSAKTACLVQHMTYDQMKRGWMCNVWNFRKVGFILCCQDIAPNYLLHVRTASSQYSLNTWNHIVFTYNGNSDLSGIKCYLNNVSKTLTVAGSNTLQGTIKSSAKLMIGHNYAYQYFPGIVDEVVIYDRVLSASEVSQRYNAGAGREDLIGTAYAQWHINEGSGVSILDATGNSLNLKTVDSPTWVAGKLNGAIQLNGSSQYITA